jgi:hypothetical protein
MSQFQDVLSQWQKQIDEAHDRIRMFESGEMAVKDTHAPFKDWTHEAITIEQQIIANLEAGIKKLRGLCCPEAPRAPPT